MAKKRRGNNEGTIVKRKDGLWMAQISVGRDPKTGRLKRHTFYGKTRKAVAEKLSKAQHDVSRGMFVEPHKITVGEWLDTWLWEYKKPSLRPITFDSYEMLVRCHLKPGLGHMALQDLRPEHVQHFYNEKKQEGLSARSVRYMHTLLYGALTQAEKNQLVTRNVATLVEPPRKERKEMNTLTLEQVSNDLLPAITDDRLFPAVFLAFGAGLRRGEVVALRWKDVDLDKGILNVRQTLVRIKKHDAEDGERKTQLAFHEPKTIHSRRTVPLPEECVSALKRYKARQAEEKLLVGQAYNDHGLIFCKPDGTPIDPREFTRYFSKLLKQAGVPSIRLHDARHTFATLMLELGESPKTVQTMLGHSNVAITLDIYSHVSLELEKKAASKLNAALKGRK